MDIQLLKDYLYLIKLDDYRYTDGFEFYSHMNTVPMACTAVRKGNYIGRNLDWYYDEHVDFVIQTPNYHGRYATIGVAHSSGDITNDNIKQGRLPRDYWRTIPFLTSDCLNEKGLYCSVNVVPAGDKPYQPVGTEGQEICQLMLPRFLCDYAENIDVAIELMENSIIFAPRGSLDQECHLLLADKNRTVVVEFVDGEMKIIEADYITNFYLDGWNGEVKSAVLGYSEDEIRATGLTDHAMGLERYMLLKEGYDDVSDVESMTELMKSVAYTKAYNKQTNPFWYSEFYGVTDTFGDLTIYSSVEDMQGIVDYAVEHYISGQRDGESWNSTHTSIYDLENQCLYVYSQEDYSEPYTIEIDKSIRYGIMNINELFSDHKKV